MFLSRIQRVLRHLAAHPRGAVLACVSLGVVLYVVIGPMAACYFPPMTDLPLHAVNASVFRHYWDPQYRFHEQFILRPVAVPYVTHYVLGALLMLFLPTVTAVKAATALMLLLLPAGMAVLLHGMKKSPHGALLTLPLTYSGMTHWAFIGFMGALGLFAMVIGCAMLVVDRPTPLRRVSLAFLLVLLFFSHIYRFPMGLVAVIGTALFLYPATRRFRPILLPILPGAILFVIWLFVHPDALDPRALLVGWHGGRIHLLWKAIFSGFHDPMERSRVLLFVVVAACVGVASGIGLVLERRLSGRTRSEMLFAIGAGVIPLGCAAVFAVFYLTFPMSIGTWWFVYPREATAAVFIVIAILPSLPRSFWPRAALVGAVSFAAVMYGRFINKSYAAFDEQTADFREIVKRLPPAPRLLYLIFDNSGTSRTMTPFVHLPAWVQAETGGFLSFSFSLAGTAPVHYRPGADPIVNRPHRWAWTPTAFDVHQHASFYDWFLVRKAEPPDEIFMADAQIERVDHVGKWWLYKRNRPGRLTEDLRILPGSVRGAGSPRRTRASAATDRPSLRGA